MLRRTAMGLLIVLSLSLLAIAFVSADDDTTPPNVIEYNISMKEYGFVVDGLNKGDPLTLEVGQPYILHIKNDGTLSHELLIGQDANVSDSTHNYHLDFAANLLDGVETEFSGQMNDKQFTITTPGMGEFEIEPGQALSFGFTLPEDKVGNWQLGCFVFSDPNATDANPGITHYDLGMKLPVVVTAASMSEATAEATEPMAEATTEPMAEATEASGS